MSISSSKDIVAVIGAGNMGSGIAQKYATHGYRVILVEKDSHNLAKSQSLIADLLMQGVKRGVFTEADAKEIIGRINFTDKLYDCRDAHLIIEAIFEDLQLKRGLLRELEGICSKDVMMATNTSSFKVSDLQGGLKYPQRVLGLHYFYHPAKNRLVEVIGSDVTDRSKIEQAQKIQESINKIAIRSNDSPGFIVNRFFVPWLNEAISIAHEGIANIATIDAAAKQFFKIGMGPFLLMNVTGLPITFHSCHSLALSFGDYFKPNAKLVAQMESGHPWDLFGPIEQDLYQRIALRLLSVVGSICYQMVDVENVCSIEDADLGARVGLLWAQGPFELVSEHLAALKAPLTDAKARGLTIPESLRGQIALS